MKFEIVQIHAFSLLSSKNFATMATWSNDFSSLLILNRPLILISAKPLLWKWVLYICIIIKNHFHINGFALSLALKVRFFGTRKWRIQSFSRDLRYVISPSWSLALSCEWYTWVSLVFRAAKPAARGGTSFSIVRNAANQCPSMESFTIAST